MATMPPEFETLIAETKRHVRILKQEFADIAEYLVFFHRPKRYIAHRHVLEEAANGNTK